MKSRTLLFGAILLYACLALTSLVKGGITWDEVLDFEGANGAFWHAINTLKGGNPDYSSITFDLEYYGNYTRWPIYLLWRLLQLSAWENLQGLPRASFIVVSGYSGLNHLSSIACGILAAFFLYKITCRLYPSSRFISPALLLTLPVWIGHSWFNSKDIPLALSYLIYTYGSTILLQLDAPVGCSFELQNRCALSNRHIAHVFRAIGISALIGSRLGMLPFVLLSELIFCTFQPSLSTLKRNLSSLGLGLFLAYLATPQAWSSPYAYIVDTFRHYSIRSSDGSQVSTLFYIFGSIIDTLPLLVLLGLALSLYPLPRSRWSKQLIPYVPIFLQGFLVPSILIVRGTSLYDEIRQIMFVYPALIFFSSIGISRLLSFAQSSSRSYSGNSLRRLCMVVIFVLWLSPILHLISLAPYQYLYRSELSRIIRPVPALNRDYWGFSVRELLANCFRDPECSASVDSFPLVRNGMSWNPDLVDATAFLIAPRRPFKTDGNLDGIRLKLFDGVISDRSCQPLARVGRRLLGMRGESTIYSLGKCQS